MCTHQKKDNDKEEKGAKKLVKKFLQEKNYCVGKSREQHENFLKKKQKNTKTISKNLKWWALFITDLHTAKTLFL